MAELTPGQERMRERVEALIALAAPALDLVLAVGDRISRIAEPEDLDYYPARPGGDQALPPDGGTSARPSGGQERGEAGAQRDPGPRSSAA